MDKIDLYDIDKIPTGRIDTHPKQGEYRLVIHLCIFSGSKMLIQRRSDNCQKWAGLWDVTLSGCAVAGEKGRDTADFIGDTYRELTRIAKINGELWSELFLYNKDELLGAMDNFEQQFRLMRTAIEEDDESGLVSLFEESTARRMDLEKSTIEKLAT